MKKILGIIFFAASLNPIYAGWHEITSPYSGNLSAIKFFNNNVGYIGANTAILKTIDGGDTWISIPTSTFSINGFSFPNDTIGYFGAHNSIIAKTTNQGVDWVNHDPGVSPYAFLSVSFPTISIGYGVGSAGTIRKTTDGGTTWIIQNSGITSNLEEVYFFDATSGICIGESGSIRRTNNGGSNWLLVNSGTSAHLHDIHFVNSSTGFIAGSEGTILKTTDGGASWTSLTSGTTEWLYAVCFKSTNEGYVAGANGTILKTTNGGNTWVAQVSGLSIDDVTDLVYINSHFMAITNSGKILSNEYIASVGINQIVLDDSSIKIFPNPASDFVSVQFDNPSEASVTISIFNANGALIKSELITDGAQTFNIQDLNGGVYIVEIKTSEFSVTKRLVIQN